MSCPRIFLVRHGQSLSNVDKKLHLTVPDHAIGLSDLGKQQAERAGKALLSYFENNNKAIYTADTIHNAIRYSDKYDNTLIWTSPYLRTRETAENLAKSFPKIPIKEHINLVEQQFGLFDGLSDDELAEKYPLEHAHYDKCEKFGGKFWARMPLGESRFDVAIRVHQFFGTMMRDFDKHGIENIIIVAHGVTNRAFAMQWLHKSFEWFENEPNPKNCSIRYLHGDTDHGYIYPGE